MGALCVKNAAFGDTGRPVGRTRAHGPARARHAGYIQAVCAMASLLLSLLGLLSLPSLAAEPAFSYQITQAGVYQGRGAKETGIVGLPATATIYSEEVQATFQLADYGWSPSSGDPNVAAAGYFEEETRDYPSYIYLSTLIRESAGLRVDGAAESPLAYIRTLAATRTQGGGYMLSDARLQRLLDGLVDGYPVEHGVLSTCAADVHAWVAKVSQSPSTDPAAIRAAIRAHSGSALRAGMAATPGTGCRGIGRRDYLFMSYGVVTHAGQGWILLAVDYGAPVGATRTIPFEQLAGTGDYCSGSFRYTVDPAKGVMDLRYGYRIDLSNYPEAIAVRYHRQILEDLVVGMHQGLLAAHPSAPQTPTP